MSFMAPDFMIIFLVSSAEDTQIQRSGPFKNTGRTYSLAPPYGWGRDLTGQRSLAGLIQMCGSPPTFPTTHTRTQQNSLLQSRRQEEGIYFWQAPQGGLRGLVTYSPPLLCSIQVSPLISPPWIADHPLCSAPGQDTLLPWAFPGLLPLIHVP